MTNEILQKMEERRQVKENDVNQYKNINYEIQHMCQQATKKWLNNKCDINEKRKNNKELCEEIDEIAGKLKGQKS